MMKKGRTLRYQIFDLIATSSISKYTFVFEDITSFLGSQRDVLSLLLVNSKVCSFLNHSSSAFENVFFFVTSESTTPEKQIRFVRKLKIRMGYGFKISPFLKSFPHISHIEISNSVIEIPSMEFFEYLPKSQISKLDIYNSPVFLNEMSHLKTLSNIEELCIGGERQSNTFFIPIRSSLKFMKKLTRIEIWNCDFGKSTIDLSENINTLRRLKLVCCYNVKISSSNPRKSDDSLEFGFDDCHFDRSFNLSAWFHTIFYNTTNNVLIKGITCVCGRIPSKDGCKLSSCSLFQCQSCNGEVFLSCHNNNSEKEKTCIAKVKELCRFCQVVDPLTTEKKTKCLHELHFPIIASSIHSNLVEYFTRNLKGRQSVTVAPSGEGIYLLFPEDNGDSRNALKSTFRNIENVSDQIVERTLYSLCETACIVTAVALSHSSSSQTTDLEKEHKKLVESFSKSSPAQQVFKMMEPVKSAGIDSVPCAIGDLGGEGWPASKKLWNCRYITESCVSISEILERRNMSLDTLDKSSIFVGHRDFQGFEFIETASIILEEEGRSMNNRGEFQRRRRNCALIPMRVRNFLQDQERYETHLIGILVFSGRIVLVDPNGIPPEDFGEPNALLLKVPWENKRVKKEKKVEF